MRWVGDPTYRDEVEIHIPDLIEYAPQFGLIYRWAVQCGQGKAIAGGFDGYLDAVEPFRPAVVELASNLDFIRRAFACSYR